MERCCEKMKYYVDNKDLDSDVKNVIYNSKFDEYGIAINDGGSSYIIIEFCPWCGKKLPCSKRDLWFEELEKMGYESFGDNDIPEKFRTCKWWYVNK